MAVTFWTTESGKRRSFRKGRRSPRLGSVSDLHGDRSNASTPQGYISVQESTNWSEDYGYATQSLSSMQVNRPDSRGSIGSNGKQSSLKKKKNRLGDSSDETLLKSLKEELEEDPGLEDIVENNGLSTSFSSSLKRTSSNKKRELPDPINTKSVFSNKDSDQSSQKGVFGGENVSLSGSVRSNRPLPQMVPKKTANEIPSSPPQTAVNGTCDEKLAVDVGVDHTNDNTNVGTVVDDDDEKPTGCCAKFMINCFKNRKNQIFPFCSKKDAILEENMKNSNMLDSKDSYPEKIPLPDITLDAGSSEISALGAKGPRGSVPSLHEASRSRRSSVTSNLRPLSRSGTPALESEPTFTRSVR